MGVVVGEIARENELPQSLLVPRAALERVAREVPGDARGFRAALELSPWRLTLVGEPLWRLLSGEVHVAIEGYAQRRSENTPIAMNQHANSFNAADTLNVGDRAYTYFRLDAVEKSRAHEARAPAVSV